MKKIIALSLAMAISLTSFAASDCCPSKKSAPKKAPMCKCEKDCEKCECASGEKTCACEKMKKGKKQKVVCPKDCKCKCASGGEICACAKDATCGDENCCCTKSNKGKKVKKGAKKSKGDK